MVKRVKDTKGLKFYCDVIIYRYLDYNLYKK